MRGVTGTLPCDTSDCSNRNPFPLENENDANVVNNHTFQNPVEEGLLCFSVHSNRKKWEKMVISLSLLNCYQIFEITKKNSKSQFFFFMIIDSLAEFLAVAVDAAKIAGEVGKEKRFHLSSLLYAKLEIEFSKFVPQMPFLRLL